MSDLGTTVVTGELANSAPVVGEPIDVPEPLLSAVSTALPSIRADAGIVAGRRVAAASLVGRAHQASGTSGQDAYSFSVSDDRSALVLVVCDGLGSRPHSAQLGAELLARFAAHSVAAIGQATAFTDGPRHLIAAVAEANERLLACAATQLPGWHPPDLATTLLVARLPLDPLGGPVLCARVGDCESFLLRETTFRSIFPDRGPRWLNTVTTTLPHPDAASVIEVATVAAVRGDVLIVATDGLADDITNSPRIRAWLAERWSAPCGAHLMVDTLRYRRQGSLDDRTAIVVWDGAVTAHRSEPLAELADLPIYPEQSERRRRRGRFRLFGR
ncbi:protein phosphatase 2C domain-containing protein [Nocardia sp. NPDC058658]|uniref:protein phosphatase 2C domain-containing protein n=1 Tax=Nocardia sp. NPDC058658 TaxID=3346580 RepID=UPI0036635FC5